MNSIRHYLDLAASKRLTGVYAAILLVAMFALAACGSDDTAVAQSCTFSSDCDLGYSCSFENECIQVSCDNCAGSSDLICLVTPEHPEGVCSRPQCTTNDQCDVAAGETCNNGVCGVGTTGGCTSDADCAADEECNLADECVPKTTDACGGCAAGETCNETTAQCESNTDPCGGCATGETCNTSTNQCESDTDVCGGCPNGQVCNTATSTCEVATSEPCGGPCPTGETCNTATNQCEAGSGSACNPACGVGEICNNGTCVQNTCPPGSQTPETCAQDPVYNLFDADNCYCAECLGDSDCNTAAGETCTANGECMACTESCNPADGESACSQPGFFCISECCIECTGNSDCSVPGEVCVDGMCSEPPSCANDPTVCRAGTTCENGVCTAPSAGASCTDAMDCFPGTCNMQTNTCEGGAGSGLPGGCSTDADCGSGQICFGGMMCQDACPSSCIMCVMGTFCMF
ncbi:hypothetical protein [Bradymonas sediminis]|uniref:Uncharacterized protein n=1 Tax=Bradymonas sediminis TaxID=1548548 RepID=A0A2Z4FK83_9DELT|nr:hypothetical protein [Bradymonas sediminis]AWV89362.1 hypothetical protein DN745_08445 [Bradymonas sediminis]TDP73542.1 hypothetical protein DFR33_106185 [Bradymonas sediminis]